MKTVLIVIILIAAFLAAGYLGVPILIERETTVLKSEVLDVKQRLQKIEEFVKSEEESRKLTQLKPDANLQHVIKSVNAISERVASIDDSFKKDMSKTDKTIKEQKSATEESLKKQAEAINKINKDTKAVIQKIMFDAGMANIRGHILKIRGDLQYKNIGTVKTELDLISDAFEKIKSSATDENKKSIEELQAILKKAKVELDTDLPAAINRIDLLWHEMGKL
jgi:hypothetical protein